MGVLGYVNNDVFLVCHGVVPYTTVSSESHNIPYSSVRGVVYTVYKNQKVCDYMFPITSIIVLNGLHV
jgi:hypothetical protein